MRARMSNQTQFRPIIQPNGLLYWFRVDLRGSPILAAALTCPALDADAAGTGTDDFVTAADRTDDAHEDAAERDRYAVG